MFEMDAYGEGVKGNFYSEEMDFGGEYAYRHNPFIKNSLFYFVPLFEEGEKHKVVHQTQKAILYEVDKGRFWVPKSLMRMDNTLVHNSFGRTYLP